MRDVGASALFLRGLFRLTTKADWTLAGLRLSFEAGFLRGSDGGSCLVAGRSAWKRWSRRHDSGASSLRPSERTIALHSSQKRRRLSSREACDSKVRSRNFDFRRSSRAAILHAGSNTSEELAERALIESRRTE